MFDIELLNGEWSRGTIEVNGTIIIVRNKVYDFIIKNNVTKFGTILHEKSVQLKWQDEYWALYQGDIMLCTKELINLFGDIPKIIYYV